MVDPRLFQALSDSTRLEILSVLAAGPINVSRIVAHVGCAQPAVSRHLRVLREASLIHDKRKGKEVEYSINQDVLLAAVDHLTGLATRPAGEAGSVERARRLVGDARRTASLRMSRRSGGKSETANRKKPGSARRAGRGKAEPGKAEPGRDQSGRAVPADFAPSEAGYTVERKPSGMDDFLL